MGRTLTVTSTLSIGSTFTIELDVVPAPDIEAETAAPLDVGRERERFDAKVLYIEDNMSNMKLAERILQRLAAVEVLGAIQGSIGLELARTQHPDLVLLDLHLPDMSGEDVLKRLNASPETKSIPVVMLTADASRRTAARLTSFGAAAFLTKPLDVKHFLDTLACYLKPCGESPNPPAHSGSRRPTG
jgi:CheY-like chemotaxis protein